VICRASVPEILAWIRGESVPLTANCDSRGTSEHGPIRIRYQSHEQYTDGRIALLQRCVPHGEAR